MEVSAQQAVIKPRSVEEFLDAYDDVPGRYEFIDGAVREMMVGVSFSHHRLANMFAFRLTALLMDDYTIGQEGFGVEVSGNVFYPDVLVTSQDIAGDARVTSEPLLTGEVLSQSTMLHDFNRKLKAYTSLPSLRHYVILAQDKPGAWVWTRDADGTFPDPVVLKSTEQVIELPGFGIEIPLSEIYR